MDHSFLRPVLRAMEFDEQVLSTFARGLIEQTQSKVHINRNFTEQINLQWGVRQGCPLSSLLFTLTMQPLMALLKQKMEEGKLQGLEITQLCHQLFADDTGLFLAASEMEFQMVRDTVRHYKSILGVLLNVQKSKMIPIYLMDGKYPEWFIDTGCTFAKEGEITEYLGCPIGYNVWPLDDLSWIPSGEIEEMA